ncbi:MAG: hypothetical protein Tsb0032_19890 [Kiloniellaceae bacterium]
MKGIRKSITYRRLGVLATAALVGLTAGCGSADTRSYKGLTVSNESVPRVGEAVMVRKNCPILGPAATEDGPEKSAAVAAGVAIPLIGIAVDLAANVVTKALSEAEEGLNGYFLALGSMANDAKDGNVDTEEIRCVIVARGLTGRSPADDPDIPESAGQLEKADLEDLGLADYPSFYLEMKASWTQGTREVPAASGGTTSEIRPILTLTPVYLHYAQSAARREGSGKKAVTVALAIASAQPADKDKLEEGASAVFRFNFGRLEVGHQYDEATLKTLNSSQVIAKGAGPSIAALVTESEQPSVALKALSEAFSSNKGDLTKALKDAISDAVGGGD